MTEFQDSIHTRAFIDKLCIQYFLSMGLELKFNFWILGLGLKFNLLKKEVSAVDESNHQSRPNRLPFWIDGLARGI